MTTAYLSNYGGNAALNYLFHQLAQSGLYLACHRDNPTVTGDLSTEIAGGGYERQPIKFSPPSGRAIASINQQVFAGMPGGGLYWLAVWDAVGQGNMIIALGLDPGNLIVPVSGQLIVPAGDVAWQF